MTPPGHAWHPAEMDDREFLLHVCRGNPSAAAFVEIVARVADVWDNLIDADTRVSAAAINAAFWDLAIELPGNAFWRQHVDDLRPVMATGIINWMAANEIERQPAPEHRAIEIAHVIRYGIADVILMVALLCGGREWAAAVGPELRLRSQKSDLQEYVNSLRGLGRATENQG